MVGRLLVVPPPPLLLCGGLGGVQAFPLAAAVREEEERFLGAPQISPNHGPSARLRPDAKSSPAPFYSAAEQNHFHPPKRYEKKILLLKFPKNN